MGLIVCHDCEQDIGESARVCPHCGAVQTEQTRASGKTRRRQIILHGTTAVVLCALGGLLGGLTGTALGAADEGMALAVIVGGMVGFVAGSVLGFWVAERATKE
jgi:outer membrane lipoprotein SlyB